MTTALTQSFQQAIDQNNIDVILPHLLAANLAVVVKSIPPGSRPEFYMTKAPGQSRFCITCAEDIAYLARIPDLEVRWMDGHSLLQQLSPAFEILLIHDRGGSYLSKDQLDWYRSSLQQ